MAGPVGRHEMVSMLPGINAAHSRLGHQRAEAQREYLVDPMAGMLPASGPAPPSPNPRPSSSVQFNLALLV
ncbi:hypothetical protein R1flu_014249 [Riccia fluitans]|uniref:Uncharacterized protein n=1 Tax=Riccia fluitans TaxID=41844 RepID=A0ABD1YFT4_9MARC